MFRNRVKEQVLIHLTKTLENALEKKEFKDFLKRHDTFYIKPNLCTMKREPATTPLRTTKIVVEYLVNNGITPYIVESDQATSKAEIRASYLGYTDLGLRLINVSDIEKKGLFTEILPNSKRSLIFSGEVGSGFINLPIIKSTDVKDIIFTCSIKNMFGLSKYRYKAKLHKDLVIILKRIFEIFKDRTYTIVDAEYAMEGKGSPVSGKLIHLPEFYISSSDLMEVDVFIARVICGFDIKQIKYLDSKKEISIDGVMPKHQKIMNFEQCSTTLLKKINYFISANLDNPIFTPIAKYKNWKLEKIIRNFNT